VTRISFPFAALGSRPAKITCLLQLSFERGLVSSTHMRRIWIVTVVLLAAAPLGAYAQEKIHVFFDTPCKCENNHGEDRWKAKTDWSAIPTAPTAFKNLRPSDMYRWAPLSAVDEHSDRKDPEEKQWCKVTGRVTEVRVQADGDIHFEMADVSSGRRGHILAEVPLGGQWCDLRTAVFSWTKKGTQFKRFQPGGILTLRRHPVVVVTGRAFFDVHHAGKNPLRNRNISHTAGILAAWEIHPVAGIKFASQTRRRHS
jgi:hypothetical protein